MSAMVQAAGMYVEKFGPLEIAASDARTTRELSPQELAAAVVSLSGEWVEAKEFAIIVAIREGYHINTHRAAKDLIATEVLAGPEVEEVGYPAGEMKQLGFSQEPIEIYAGEVRIHVRLKEAQSKAIALSLRYQACDESACLPPVTRRIQIPVE
jgi:thiol:disulfide interchange protein